MINHSSVGNSVFRAQDRVVLAQGPYEGTPGVFLNLRQDANWADIEERNNVVRSHPVKWLRLADQREKPDVIPPVHE